jgi:lipoyl(octanoyl) transferase
MVRNLAERERDRAVDFHLLGVVPFDDVLYLQRRLVYELSSEPQARAAVLLCEHPPILTVGRAGSRGHIRMSNDELQRRRLATRWVNRSGGCIPHTPGQLAVYAIVPLPEFGLTRKDFRRRMASSGMKALIEAGVPTQCDPRGCGLWGRTGLLAAVGAGIQGGTTCDGLFINVAPDMSLFGFVDTAEPSARGGERTTMSCLLAERRQPVRMSTVRSALIEQLAASIECDRHNLHTSHVWLRDRAGSERERIA